MAVTETRTLPAPFIESLGQDYASGLKTLVGDKIDTSQFAPTVAGQDPLQTQAATLAGTTGKGIDAFAPYLSTAAGYSGPDAYSQFMSPYQQQAIDATMSFFDKQAAQQRRGISDQAKQVGAYGGSRMGVQQSEYDAASDMNRALLQSQLQQQGFGQAQAGAAQAFQQQQGLAGLVPSLYQQDIATLGTVGATQQAQAQAQADATREGSRMEAFEPYERLGFYGQGLTGLMGGYPAQYQFSSIPNPTPLQTALGTGSTLAGIYGAVKGANAYSNLIKGLS